MAAKTALVLDSIGQLQRLQSGDYLDDASVPVDAVCEGRLTLATGDPVPTTDQSGTTIHFTPDSGDKISIYDGSRLRTYTFTERSLSLGTVVKHQGYDVFIYDNAGTLTLEKEAWASATVTMTVASPCVVTWTNHGMETGMSVTFTSTGSLPAFLGTNTQYIVTKIDNNSFKISQNHYDAAAGTFLNTSGSQSGTHTGHNPQARQTALVRQNGAWYKSGALTRRYLGSFIASSTTATSDTDAFRGLFDAHRPVAKRLRKTYSVDSWNYASATWRITNADADYKVEAFCGLPRDDAWLHNFALSLAFGLSGIGWNGGTTPAGVFFYTQAAGASSKPAEWIGKPRLGYNAWLGMELAGSGTVTFYGDAGDPTTFGFTTLQGAFRC